MGRPPGWCSCWPGCPTTRRPRRPSSTWAGTAVTRGRARVPARASTSTAWASSPTATAWTCRRCRSRAGSAASRPRRAARRPRRPRTAAHPVRRRHRLDRHRGMMRGRADAALFVMSRPGDRFAAIERPAAVTGLPVVRAGRRDRPAAAAVARARLPERARAGHRDPVRDRGHGRAARRPGRGGDVQRVVGVGRHAGGRRARRQPPVLQERGVRGRVPAGAGGRARRPGRLLLRAPARSPSCGWRGGSPR